ncbi:MAG: hypothetical protein HUK18_06095 [Bacteroidales bacterium]|nr:hypothetical protein [Bacteroidales bacterium]
MANMLHKVFGGSNMINFFTKYAKITALIIILLVCLIAFRYVIEGEVRKIYKLSSEISDLQKRSSKIKTTYQITSSMARIDANLEPIGVGISTEPIKGMIIYEEESKKNNE